MKLLVLSDSYSGLRFMRDCISKVRPDVVIHLGDHYDDGQALAQEYPHLVFHQVPGNCDRYRCPMNTPQILCYPIAGVRVYMTHGHCHHVKQGLWALLPDARKMDAKLVLYGHTHQADCHREEDGLWVMNPGSCGSYSGSAGVVKIENNEITACYLITQADLEGNI